MMAIASGRDPAEVEELKDKLASANADREALIARLRDAQIQMQIKNTHLLELQTSIIDKLSLISSPKLKSKDDVELHPDVERWIEK
jgi:chromosome condensin MukBEF ATPase and DNA-binding subunit MukB